MAATGGDSRRVLRARDTLLERVAVNMSDIVEFLACVSLFVFGALVSWLMDKH